MTNYSIEKTVRSGHGNFKERLHVKAFKDSDAMYTFLCSKYNDWNIWKESVKGFKTGIYAYAGGQYHNVKSLDISILAHI